MRTIATFSKPQEAHLLIARLEGSGIAAFARDEHMVTLDWLASNAIGGVKVDVADEDWEQALDVLNEGKAATPETPRARDRGFGRYLILFGIVAGLVFAVMLALLREAGSSALEISVLTAVFVAGVVAFVCATMDV